MDVRWWLIDVVYMELEHEFQEPWCGNIKVTDMAVELHCCKGQTSLSCWKMHSIVIGLCTRE